MKAASKLLLGIPNVVDIPKAESCYWVRSKKVAFGPHAAGHGVANVAVSANAPLAVLGRGKPLEQHPREASRASILEHFSRPCIKKLTLA